jgi:uncharacterized integral membrane protein (TIGR00698 family)
MSTTTRDLLPTTARSAIPGTRARLHSGLLWLAAGTAAAYAVHLVVPAMGVLTIAVVLGALLRNAGVLPAATPGLQTGGRALLRLGVALLGLQLSVAQVTRLGWRQLAVVGVTVTSTFVLTMWAGRRLGCGQGTTLLVATGFSICGVSAAAAMAAASDSDEDDLTSAVTLVTLFGTLAVVVLPALRGPLGLDGPAFGVWVGASVHEVAQVVAASSMAGATALTVAVVVKLTRVALLAPLVAGTSLVRRRRDPGSGSTTPVPLFLVGFLTAMAARSTGAVPDAVLDAARLATGLLLTGALFGLGAAVDARALLRAGARPLALGLVSTVGVTTVAFLGVVLVT